MKSAIKPLMVFKGSNTKFGFWSLIIDASLKKYFRYFRGNLIHETLLSSKCTRILQKQWYLLLVQSYQVGFLKRLLLIFTPSE